MSKSNNMIDLADMDTGAASDKGAEIELRHPTTHAKLGMFITVLGKDSEVFREHTKHRANERLRREAMADRTGKPLDPPTAEDAEEKAIELLVLCTTGWRQETDGKSEATLFYKGEHLTFTIANAKRLYAEQLWIRRQVDVAIGDLENFIKA